MSSDPFTDYGANWHMPAQAAWEQNLEAVRHAILAVKAKWDLAP
jgi:hypothetical protein